MGRRRAWSSLLSEANASAVTDDRCVNSCPGAEVTRMRADAAKNLSYVCGQTTRQPLSSMPRGWRARRKLWWLRVSQHWQALISDLQLFHWLVLAEQERTHDIKTTANGGWLSKRLRQRDMGPANNTDHPPDFGHCVDMCRGVTLTLRRPA